MGQELHILENGHTGHLLVYVRILIERAQRDGYHVILHSTDEVFESAEYQQILAPRCGYFSTSTNGADLGAVLDAAKNETLIIPHGDFHLSDLLKNRKRLARISSARVLIMRDPAWEPMTGFYRMARTFAKHIAIWLASTRIYRMDILWMRGTLTNHNPSKDSVVDPYISDYSTADLKIRGTHYRKDDFGIDCHWFLVAGAITARKNLRLILVAIANFRRRVPEARIGLAVVGPIRDESITENEVLEILDALGVHTCIVNRLVSNDELNTAIAAADTLLMAYSSSAPNSTLVKARVLGTRTIVMGPRNLRSFASQVGADIVGKLTEYDLSAGIEAAYSDVNCPTALAPPTEEDFYLSLVSPGNLQ